MAIERPTFSESWYRVSSLRPRLRPTVQVHRQHYRGHMWHVLQDPSSGQFFRLNDAAYRFVALLDGRRTVAEVWRICNEQLDDAAPTQGEAIQLLGQMYTSNLLQAELPPDAEGLFSRYKKRVQREVQGYLMNLLFIRFPLFDPDRILNKLVHIFGRVFTWYGLAIWLVIIAGGVYALTGKWEQLTEGTRGILNPSSLPLLYASFLIVKAFHEFGHAFACKWFGRRSGTGGEVHTMGIMLLVLVPMPYVDASSAWAFRSKWHRVIVGASGMYVELAIAAVAAMIWAQVPEESMLSPVCYRVMLIASISTLLFNGNPLLRYDAYYILSDILEIPNLAQRSKQYIYYVVRKYVWGVRHVRNPAHSGGEKAWFLPYGVASTVYRFFIFGAIIWRVMQNEKLFGLGILLAATGLITWLIVPIGKFIHYLMSSNELSRNRPRAVGTTAVVVGGLVVLVGLIPWPDRFRVEGVVEPDPMRRVYVERTSGVLEEFAPHGSEVEAGKTVLYRLSNPEMKAQRQEAAAMLEELITRQIIARAEEGEGAAQRYDRKIEAARQRVVFLDDRISRLVVVAPASGTWIAPELDKARGTYLEHGQQIGMVVGLDRLTIRANADQTVPVMDVRDRTEMRIRGLPKAYFEGTIVKRSKGGTKHLASPALGFGVGGSIETDPTDQKGLRARENVFELTVEPDPNGLVEPVEDTPSRPYRLQPGQRVILRLEADPQPLIFQWYRGILQLAQRRPTRTG
jgi:putative peptide zinc metalloprotease protein